MATVTIAPIAARSATGGVNGTNVYKTGSRSVPAGTYKEILFLLTFNAEATDFVPGDVLFGAVELSTDGGVNFSPLCEAEWHGGTNKGRGYGVAVDNLTVPANSFYRASARVVPGIPGGTITFGVTANVIQ